MTVSAPVAVRSKAAVASKRKVFIVDDHPIVREGLAQMINREPDLAVCGDAREMQEALASIDVHKPDILIVDISLNGPDGLDLLKIRAFRSLFSPCTMNRFMPSGRCAPARTVTS